MIEGELPASVEGLRRLAFDLGGVRDRVTAVERAVAGRLLPFDTGPGDLVGFDADGNPVLIDAAAGDGYALTSDISQVGGATWVGKPAYTAPTLLGTWANYGTWRGAGYFKDRDGIVFMTGLVKRTGTSGTTIFTLPTGYRPDAITLMLLGGSWGGVYQHVRIDIDTSGNVSFINDPGTAVDFISLSSVPPFLGS